MADEIIFHDDVISVCNSEIAEMPSNLETLQLVQAEPGENSQDSSDIIFDRAIFQETLTNLSSFYEVSREMGGILIGEYGINPSTGRRFTHVVDFITIPKDIVQRAGSTFAFSEEAHAYVLAKMDKLNERNQTDYSFVGPAHTHPNFGAFISAGSSDGREGDDNLHAHFDQPGQISLIYDPIRGELAVYSKGGSALRETQKLNHIKRDEFGRVSVVSVNPVEKNERGIAGAHGMRLHKQILISNPPQEITVQV